MKFPDILNKKIYRISGIVGLVIGVVLLILGLIGVFTNDMTADSEGFYSIWNLKIENDSYAVLIKPEGMELSPGREVAGLSSFKIEVTNGDPTKPLFIGLAHEFDTDKYLSGIEYKEITDIYIFPTRVDFRSHSGNGMPEAPTLQKFWVESYYGTGTQGFTWEIEPDRNWLVIMNEDGTAGTDMNIIIGAKAQLLVTLGLGNLFLGIGALVMGLFLLYTSGRSINVAFPGPLK
ncbi:hypothetical protein ACFLYN_03295 [Chloroflexota bacterium]